MVEFSKKVLSNGLTVLHEKRDVPVTTVMLGTKYGSRYETESEKGMAHFIEHLCFKGTEKRTAKEIAKEIEGVGGILNAFTSEEVTAYHAKFPSVHLKKVVEVLFDIYYNPIFPEEDVKREAEVICEEIKMYYDNPRAHTLESIKEQCYAKPFGMFIGGPQENVRGMTREILLKKHREVYTPHNSVMIVVGNNSFEEVLKLAEEFQIERAFNKISKPEIIERTAKEEEHRSNLQQSNIALGFHFPKANDTNRFAAEVFSDILGGGMSSRLFTEVREKRGLVYGVKTAFDSGVDYGYLMIWAGTDPSKVEEVKAVCLEEFRKMANLTEEELTEAKTKLLGSNKVSLESSDEVARELLVSWIEGKPESFYNFEKEILKVTLEDVKKLAEKTEFSFFSLGP